MALPDWILGVLFRPGETFERARTEMTFSYWWILLSVVSLEAVLYYYSPQAQAMVPRPTADATITYSVIMNTGFLGMFSLCLFGAGRLLGWPLTFADAVKYAGLLWGVTLLEDLVVFYPYLMNQLILVFWVPIPFMLWRVIALTAGVRRLTEMPLWRALLLSLLANLPWQGWLLYENYRNIFLA